MSADFERVKRERDELRAVLAPIVEQFDKQVASYIANGDEAIARISIQVHGKRMAAARDVLNRVSK